MSKGHRGAHRCNDPRCIGCDRQRIYKRIKKFGAVPIIIFDGIPSSYIYSVELFANYMLPELVIRVPDLTPKDDVDMATRLFSVADYLSQLPEVGEGTPIPSDPFGVPMWLWGEDPRNRARSDMGIARDYYRDIHLRRLEDVPVYFVSPKPHPESPPLVDMPFVIPMPGGIVERIFAHIPTAKDGD